MIVSEDDLINTSKLQYKKCHICDKEFQIGQSYEKITTHRKSKLVVHTDCICRKGENK